MCTDRILLGVISGVSLAISVTYLFLFSIPHNSWVPTSPAWQEVSLKIVNLGATNTTWIPADDRYLLLTVIASAIGSLGFDRDQVFNELFDYWGPILIGTSIYSLLNMISCVLIFVYVLKFYQVKYRYLVLPWIILSSILFTLLLALLVTMLYYLGDSARIVGEISQNKSTYGEAITVVICYVLFHYACCLLVILHYLESEEKAFRINFFHLRGREQMGGPNGSNSGRGAELSGVEVQQNPPTPPPGYDEAVESSWMRTRLANFGIQRDPVRLVRFNHIPTNIPNQTPATFPRSSDPNQVNRSVEARGEKLDMSPSTSSSTSQSSNSPDHMYNTFQLQPQLHLNRNMYTSTGQTDDLRRI